MQLLIPSVCLCLCACLGSAHAAGGKQERVHKQEQVHKQERAHAQRAKPQVGKASIYARKFAGRKMANGERMDPQSNNAASKTLPIGTKARVTNLDTGRSAVVEIEDRGPYVPGRIVDLSPASAAEIGLTHKEGLARVEVVPIELPSDKPRIVAGN